MDSSSPRRRRAVRRGRPPGVVTIGRMATTWEYATIPLLIHNTKAILDQWGADGWELVQVVPGPDSTNLVAYLKRPSGGQ